MARKTPTVRNNILIVWNREQNRQIAEFKVDSTDWFNWLNNPDTKSFRYVSGTGSFTAVKESRRQGRKLFWYAHRRVEGKLKRKYLGISHNLTQKKLYRVAFELKKSKG